MSDYNNQYDKNACIVLGTCTTHDHDDGDRNNNNDDATTTTTTASIINEENGHNKIDDSMSTKNYDFSSNNLNNNNNNNIVSLHELIIPISNEIKEYLSQQYFVLYNNNKMDAINHLNRVLDTMKTSPRTTICRINTLHLLQQQQLKQNNDESENECIITTTIENYKARIKKELFQYLEQWIQQRQQQLVDHNEDNDDDNHFDMTPINNKNNNNEDKNMHNLLSYDILINDHPILENVISIRTSIKDTNNSSNDVTYHHQNIYNQRKPNNKNNIINSNNNQLLLFSNWSGREKYGWPISHRVVVVDRFCGEAIIRGSDIYVRGILYADTNIQKNDIIAVYADYDNNNNDDLDKDNNKNDTSSKPNILSRGMILREYIGRKCVYLGLGKSICKRSEYFHFSSGLAIEMLPQSRSPPPTNNYCNNVLLPPLSGILSNEIILQNEPSIVVAYELLKDLPPSSSSDTITTTTDNSTTSHYYILDMCSAPGGKTLHLASCFMNKNNSNNATIIACDKSRKKMIKAKELFTKLGATNIIPLALDSTKCVIRSNDEINSNKKKERRVIQDVKNSDHHCDSSDKNTMTLEELVKSAIPSSDGLLKIKGFPPETFDRILLDPPCSALGLRPKLQVTQTTVKELQAFAQYQKLFIDEAVELLKPGGIMTYSTCTIHSMENEGMVQHILEKYSNVLELVPICIPLGLPGLPGFGLNEQQCNFVRRFDPSDKNYDTIGFFIAKFQKKGMKIIDVTE